MHLSIIYQDVRIHTIMSQNRNHTSLLKIMLGKRSTSTTEILGLHNERKIKQQGDHFGLFRIYWSARLWENNTVD